MSTPDTQPSGEKDATIAALTRWLERQHKPRSLPTIPIGTRVRVRNMGVGTVVGRDGYGFDGVAVIFDEPAPGGFRDGCCAGVEECEVIPPGPQVCPECHNTDPDACVRCITAARSMTDHRDENEPMTLPEQFSTQYDDEHWFPFIEDENCNITGYDHQDKAEFAAAINRYDEVCNGEPSPEEDQWEASDVGHAWVVVAPDGEHLLRCEPDTEGAIPVTEMWGAR